MSRSRALIPAAVALALSAAPAQATTVKSRGPSVRLAQRHLRVAADGVFGPAHARARSSASSAVTT